MKLFAIFAINSLLTASVYSKEKVTIPVIGASNTKELITASNTKELIAASNTKELIAASNTKEAMADISESTLGLWRSNPKFIINSKIGDTTISDISKTIGEIRTDICKSLRPPDSVKLYLTWEASAKVWGIGVSGDGGIEVNIFCNETKK